MQHATFGIILNNVSIRELSARGPISAGETPI